MRIRPKSSFNHLEKQNDAADVSVCPKRDIRYDCLLRPELPQYSTTGLLLAARKNLEGFLGLLVALGTITYAMRPKGSYKKNDPYR